MRRLVLASAFVLAIASTAWGANATTATTTNASGQLSGANTSGQLSTANTPGQLSGTNVSGQLSSADFAVLAAYLLTLVLIGVYFSRRERTTSDFFLAGRRVPWWAAGISIFATQTSAITFMAIPAKVYATDWTYLLAYATIPAVAPLVVYVYLPFFRRLDITTAYEYLERRFNIAARLFGSTAFVLMQLARMGIILCLPALALASVSDLPVWLCIVAMGVLCTVYTALGGIEAVIWTDVLQVVVLLGGALLSLGIIVAGVDGGIAGVLTVAHADAKLHAFNWTFDHTVAAVWVVVIGNMFITLGPYTTDQVVIQRYLTTRTEKLAAKAIWTNAILTVPAAAVFFAVGTALYVFYKAHPAALDPSVPTESVFPWFIATQLPVGVAGLVIAGLFAAAMSSLDSSLNSIAAALVTDFYRRFASGVTDQRCLKLARWLTILAGIFGTSTALLIASLEITSLWDLFVEVLGILTGSLSGLFALGIFTRRATGTGGLIGAAASIVAVVAVRQLTDLHFFLYAAVAVATCLAVGYVASLLLGSSSRPLQGLTIYTMNTQSQPHTSTDTET